MKKVKMRIIKRKLTKKKKKTTKCFKVRGKIKCITVSKAKKRKKAKCGSKVCKRSALYSKVLRRKAAKRRR